ncbi:MAG: LPS export ABC transporter periplasmic protein LptC [Gammaproteobacteria bacterium]|nr:LPS export ABC transporter periplasmic protein LptC [Gammaproteobacteria bacterium]
MRLSVDKRLLTVALLAAAAAASWWWSQQQEAPGRAPETARGDRPDYYLTGFELTEMNAAGAVERRLDADDLYHYPDRATSTLTRPRLVVYEDGRAAWNIAALRGTASERERLINLQGDVRVNYSGVDPKEDMRMYTNELDVWPDSKLAETRAAVRIEDRAGVTRAVGMTADLARRRTLLHAEVRSEYAP